MAGVHQDGLVHISMLANRFVKVPREVVKVKVLEVDAKRKRIALTMKLDAAPESRNDESRSSPRNDSRSMKPRQAEPQGSGAMADALAEALRRR